MTIFETVGKDVVPMPKKGGAAEVAIVGAGPVGLALALRLAQFGIASIVLDAKPAHEKQGSKACLIQGDVLEVIDKLGHGDEIAQQGVGWRVGRTYIRGQEIRCAVYPDRVGYAPFVNISQYDIERLLARAAEASPLVKLHWGVRVGGIEQDGAGVTLTMVVGGVEQRLRTRFAVGCDGVRSVVRELIGSEWKGYRHNDRFLITDIKGKLPFSKERHFHYDSPFNPGRQLIIHPQPNDVWRVDWQLAPDTDIEAEKADGRLDARIRKVIGDTPYEIDWMSTYRFNQRVADPFTVGRVFLAGDAAHSLPPYGSRGMNSGIQDADNLAWKLAYVLHGYCGEELLKTYHEERYAAALENLAVTEATIRFMVPPTPLHRLWRNALLTASKHFPMLRRLVDSGKMAEPFHYPPSDIVAEGHPLAGAFAPDAPVEGEGRRLRRAFGRGFTWVYIGEDPAAAASAIPLQMDLPFSPDFVVTASAAGAFGDGLQLARRDGFGPEALASLAGSWTLVRPDGYIAAVVPAVPTPDFAGLTARCSRAAAAAPAYALAG